jgi:hypothetical protein
MRQLLYQATATHFLVMMAGVTSRRTSETLGNGNKSCRKWPTIHPSFFDRFGDDEVGRFGSAATEGGMKVPYTKTCNYDGNDGTKNYSEEDLVCVIREMDEGECTWDEAEARIAEEKKREKDSEIENAAGKAETQNHLKDVIEKRLATFGPGPHPPHVQVKSAINEAGRAARAAPSYMDFSRGISKVSKAEYYGTGEFNGRSVQDAQDSISYASSASSNDNVSTTSEDALQYQRSTWEPKSRADYLLTDSVYDHMNPVARPPLANFAPRPDTSAFSFSSSSNIIATPGTDTDEEAVRNAQADVPVAIPQPIMKKELAAVRKQNSSRTAVFSKANETASMALGKNKKYSWMTGGGALCESASTMRLQQPGRPSREGVPELSMQQLYEMDEPFTIRTEKVSSPEASAEDAPKASPPKPAAPKSWVELLKAKNAPAPAKPSSANEAAPGSNLEARISSVETGQHELGSDVTDIPDTVDALEQLYIGLFSSVKALETASNRPSTAGGSKTTTPPQTAASPQVGEVHFRIPPQSDLSDTDYIFLLKKLQGKQISAQAWSAAVSRIQTWDFGSAVEDGEEDAGPSVWDNPIEAEESESSAATSEPPSRFKKNWFVGVDSENGEQAGDETKDGNEWDEAFGWGEPGKDSGGAPLQQEHRQDAWGSVPPQEPQDAWGATFPLQQDHQDSWGATLPPQQEHRKDYWCVVLQQDRKKDTGEQKDKQQEPWGVQPEGYEDGANGWK